MQLTQDVEGPWPKRLTLYACISKESNCEKGERIGLMGEALRLFMHFEEIALDIAVAEDGMVTVLACNGKPVQ